MTAFPSNLPGLTSVRFLLALGVVFFHYQLQWPWDAMSATGLLDRARLGVDIFFILSGFVLTHAYREALDAGRLNYRRFIVARVARISPAHVAVLLFVLAMVGSALLVGADFDARLYEPSGLLPTLLLIHAWYPEEFAAKWNGPSWSLSAEWFAYLVFPLFAWVGLKLRQRPCLLLGLSSLIFLTLAMLLSAGAFGSQATSAPASTAATTVEAPSAVPTEVATAVLEPQTLTVFAAASLTNAF